MSLYGRAAGAGGKKNQGVCVDRTGTGCWKHTNNRDKRTSDGFNCSQQGSSAPRIQGQVPKGGWWWCLWWWLLLGIFQKAGSVVCYTRNKGKLITLSQRGVNSDKLTWSRTGLSHHRSSKAEVRWLVTVIRSRNQGSINMLSLCVSLT